MWRVSALTFALLCLCLSDVSANQSELERTQTTILKLEKAVRTTSKDETLISQLSIAYNNYAILLGQSQRWSESEEYLRKAISLSGGDAQYENNLVALYINQAAELMENTKRASYSREQHREAKRLVQQAIRLNPKSAEAYILLGDIEYDNQSLTKAKSAWQTAKKLDPSSSLISERLNRLNQEYAVETDFKKIHNSFFDIRFEDGVERQTGFDYEKALMKARRDVGTDFRYWPKHKFVVLLYNGDTFRNMRTGTPEWVAGQFDGKIRLPLPNQAYPESMVNQLTFHEYTHALIGDLNQSSIPVWYNEGLAEYEGAKYGTPEINLVTAAYEQDALVPWAQMGSLFSQSRPPQDIALGYQQAHSVVAFLSQKYGFWRHRKVLEDLNNGMGIEQSIEKQFKSKIDRLEKSWRLWLPEFIRKKGKR